MGSETRWVVVGYGMGWHHARYIEQTPGLALHGICDISPERLAKAKAEHPGARPFTSFEAALADPDAQGMVVVTPHNTHAPLAIQAMRAGKHVITDKAMCLTVPEAEAMIGARDAHRVLLSVFHNRRWDGDFVAVRKILADYELGDLYHIQSCVTDWGNPGGWRADRAAMGGWLFDWGAHTLDQILLLARSRPVSVYAFSHYRFDEPSSVEDYINCTITFESGLTATTVVGYVNMIPMPRWYVVGRFGAAECPGFDTAVKVRKMWNGERQERLVPLAPSDWPAYYRNIADALSGKCALEVTPEQVLPQIAIAEAAYRSIETQQAVRL
jgi:predicted dehydrogenase